jgi:hypothetical protein
MTNFIPPHDAATLANVSLRTIHRWVKSGRIQSKAENGRTFVSIPPELVATTRPDALLVEGLRASAEESSKVAALVGRHAEETALALRSAVESAERRADRAEDRADRAERRIRWTHNVAAVLLAALSVTVAYNVFTSRQLATVADTVNGERERAEALKADLDRSRREIEARDTARQLADARADEAEDRARRFEAVVGILAGDECQTPPSVADRSRP